VSTYLELVQDLHRETGASGPEPTTVIGLRGEADRLVGWVKSADMFIQELWVTWRFLWDQFDTGNVTTASTNALLAPSNLNFWDFKTFKIIEPGETDENPLTSVEYDSIKRDILDTSEDIPSRAIVMPDNNLKFEPVPDAAYTILADYYKKPTPLAANGDVSLIPEEYHQAIVGRAMILYANYENAPEIKDQGKEIYIEQLARLENHQLPNLENSRYTTGGVFQVNATDME
jgi:hypothetical protein